MANQVMTPIQNYFEKVLYEKFDMGDCSLVVIRVVRDNKSRNKTLWVDVIVPCSY